MAAVSTDLQRLRSQLLGLIGPNGAGKTSLFNCLSRLYTPVSGDILFDGRSILKSYAMLFEIRRCLALIPLNRHSSRV